MRVIPEYARGMLGKGRGRWEGGESGEVKGDRGGWIKTASGKAVGGKRDSLFLPVVHFNFPRFTSEAFKRFTTLLRCLYPLSCLPPPCRPSLSPSLLAVIKGPVSSHPRGDRAHIDAFR